MALFDKWHLSIVPWPFFPWKCFTFANKDKCYLKAGLKNVHKIILVVFKNTYRRKETPQESTLNLFYDSQTYISSIYSFNKYPGFHESNTLPTRPQNIHFYHASLRDFNAYQHWRNTGGAVETQLYWVFS